MGTQSPTVSEKIRASLAPHERAHANTSSRVPSRSSRPYEAPSVSAEGYESCHAATTGRDDPPSPILFHGRGEASRLARAQVAHARPETSEVCSKHPRWRLLVRRVSHQVVSTAGMTGRWSPPAVPPPRADPPFRHPAPGTRVLPVSLDQTRRHDTVDPGGRCPLDDRGMLPDGQERSRPRTIIRSGCIRPGTGTSRWPCSPWRS